MALLHRASARGLCFRQTARRYSNTTNPSRTPRDLLIEASLRRVPELGWSKQAIAAGALDVGLPPVAHTMLPRGAYDLLHHHQTAGNVNLRDFLEDLTAPTLSKTDDGAAEHHKPETVVAAGIRHRLEHTLPFAASWAEAMALGARPEHIPATLEHIAAVSDELCYYAGDRSTDGQWYARRAAVSAVYVSAELFMLTDHSDGNQELWDFVEQRVADAANAETQFGQAGELASVLDQGLGTLFSAAGSLLRSPAVGGLGAGLSSMPLPPGGPKVAAELLGHVVRTASGLARDSGSALNAARTAASRFADAAPDGAGGAAASAEEKPSENPQTKYHDDDAMDDLILPDGLSLWGLLSTQASEAEAMIRASNPSFSVLLVEATAPYAPMSNPALVRLFFDTNGVVVNVDRGEGSSASSSTGA